MKGKTIKPRKFLAAPLTLAAMLLGWVGEIPLVLAQGTSEVEIVMKDREFQVLKGGTDYRTGFSIIAGMPTAVSLRNEDSVAHEFVSPMFRNIQVQLTGDATTVTTHKAAGFRIDPGKNVTLRFEAPVSEDFTTQYDLFWCNVHGKLHGENMRGEILILETRGEIM